MRPPHQLRDVFNNNNKILFVIPLKIYKCLFQTIVERAPQILRMADLDLFQDLKENPFDVHFRKATEAVKAGQDGLSASLAASEIPGEEQESLNTPQIFCESGTGGSSPTLTSRPVILRSHSHNRVVQQTSNIPVASVQPVKAFKAIAPSPSSLPFSQTSDNALLLLKLPTGETVKLSNLPFVKCDPAQPPPGGGGGGGITVKNETKLKLKKSLKTSRSPSTAPSTGESSSAGPPGGASALEERDDLRDDLKERNRMSAQRSRLKKRQQLEEMQAEKSVLSSENKALRAEVWKLKQILRDHLDCSVTVRTGARETLSRQVCAGDSQDQAVTQTAVDCEQFQHQQSAFRYEGAASPPQTYPEDLRVRVHTNVDTKVDTRAETKADSKEDDRLKQDEKLVPPDSSSVSPLRPVLSSSPGTDGRKSKIKQRLALHCEKVGKKKKLKATNKARLKDKLQIIKQKMVEDEHVWSSLQSTKNK